MSAGKKKKKKKKKREKKRKKKKEKENFFKSSQLTRGKGALGGGEKSFRVVSETCVN